MAKEAFYFSHDHGARNDPKLQKVLMKLGQEGKGVFWDLIEISFEEGGKLLLSECESYAFALRADIKILLSLINDFGLFEKDELYFWSNSVLNRLDLRKEKSEKARISAKKRWDNANALPTQSECNAIKERKVKERKVKEKEKMFEEFYSNYPIKKSPAKAKEKFLSLLAKGTSFQDIMTGLYGYLSEIKAKKTETKYIKHPTTWLNQGCWDDEYETLSTGLDESTRKLLGMSNG